MQQKNVPCYLIANQLFTIFGKSPRCGLQYGGLNATFSNSLNKSVHLTVRGKKTRIIQQVQGLDLDASIVFIVYYYNNTIFRGYCTTGLAGRLFLHTPCVSNRRLQTSNWRLKHLVLEFSRGDVHGISPQSLHFYVCNHKINKNVIMCRFYIHMHVQSSNVNII